MAHSHGVSHVDNEFGVAGVLPAGVSYLCVSLCNSFRVCDLSTGSSGVNQRILCMFVSLQADTILCKYKYSRGQQELGRTVAAGREKSRARASRIPTGIQDDIHASMLVHLRLLDGLIRVIKPDFRDTHTYKHAPTHMHPHIYLCMDAWMHVLKCITE